MSKLEYSKYVMRKLYGELSVEENFLFEEQLKTDAELQKELNFQKSLDAAITDDYLENFKKRLDIIHKNIEIVSAKHIRKTMFSFLVRAAMIFLIIVTISCVRAGVWNLKRVSEVSDEFPIPHPRHLFIIIR